MRLSISTARDSIVFGSILAESDGYPRQAGGYMMGWVAPEGWGSLGDMEFVHDAATDWHFDGYRASG
jgi:hypothetical protein